MIMYAGIGVAGLIVALMIFLVGHFVGFCCGIELVEKSQHDHAPSA